MSDWFSPLLWETSQELSRAHWHPSGRVVVRGIVPACCALFAWGVGTPTQLVEINDSLLSCLGLLTGLRASHFVVSS